MALTEEQLQLQADILASKTDSTTNPNMAYKTNATLNKGLNPEFFTGNNTKIVNAINKLASDITLANSMVTDVSDKVNEVLLDTSSTVGQAVLEEVRALMEQDTVLEGVRDILKGQQIDKILGLNVADKGKVLSIDEDENGNLILKAIDAIAGGGSVPAEVSAEAIEYTNANASNVSNVKEALDYVINKIANGDFDGEWGGGFIAGEITWDMIDDRPEFIADGLEMTDSSLVLKDGDAVLSTVQLMTNQDIDDLLADLK